MTLYNNFLDVEIDSVDLSAYAINYNRTSSICEPGDMFTIVFSRKKPDDTFINIDTSDDIIIKERYGNGFDRVLKGFATSITVDSNNGQLIVSGADKYIMLADYFIDTRLETNGQSVAYWIQYIANLAGLDTQFDSYPYIATTGTGDEEGTPLGMQFALDAIRTLERKGAVYTRYDSDIDKLVVYRLNTSKPQITISSNNLLSITRGTGTESTRNVVKVWGGYRYDWTTGEEQKYLASASRTMDELVVDKTSVIASPEIKSFTFANIVASRILATNAVLDDIVIADCAGLYPDITIGEWAYINISQGEFDYTRERQITSISASVDVHGATTSFTFGERCPRISISPPVTPVYVTDDKNGVGVSWDAGESFVPSNLGLTTTEELDGKSIAVNNYGRQFCITAAGMHKRTSSGAAWVDVTNLPDPTNESNDPDPLGIADLGMIKVVDEPLKPYTFHAVATASGSGGVHPSGWRRNYVYTTKDYGASWNTTQMWAPASTSGYQEHANAPYGKVYDVYFFDMIASLGNEVYTLVGESPPSYPECIIYVDYLGGSQWEVGYWNEGDDPVSGLVVGQRFAGATISDLKVFVCPNDPEIAYACFMWIGGTGHVGTVYRTRDGGKTWGTIWDQTAYADFTTRTSITWMFDWSSDGSVAKIALCGWHDAGNIYINPNWYRRWYAYVDLIVDNPDIDTTNDYQISSGNIDLQGDAINTYGIQGSSGTGAYSGPYNRETSGTMYYGACFYRRYNYNLKIVTCGINFSNNTITHADTVNVAPTYGSDMSLQYFSMLNRNTGLTYYRLNERRTFPSESTSRILKGATEVISDYVDTALGMANILTAKPLGNYQKNSNDYNLYGSSGSIITDPPDFSVHKWFDEGNTYCGIYVTDQGGGVIRHELTTASLSTPESFETPSATFYTDAFTGAASFRQYDVKETRTV